MRVQLIDNQTIGVFFPYDPALVNLIKSLPGRTYEPRLKAWLLPVDGLLQSNLNKLKAVGFDVSAVERVLGQPAAGAKPINDLNVPEMPNLYPFQQQGVKFLLSGNGLLGDQPGLGKTVQAITACKISGVERILVLTFASLKYQFQAEVKKFWPHAATVVIDGNKEERAHQWNQPARFYVANYELLLRDLEVMAGKKWDVIICDECTRLSNHTNKQSRALKFLRGERKIAMTGTAISNSPLDIFGIIEWLRPGVLGNYFHFANRYVQKDQWGGPKFYKNLDELALRIQPFFLRRTKTQVLPDLPEKVKISIPFELSEKERKLYDQIKKELLFEIEALSINKIGSPVQLQNTIVKLMRLRQLANGMELIGEHTDSTKLQVLKDLLDTLELLD